MPESDDQELKSEEAKTKEEEAQAKAKEEEAKANIRALMDQLIKHRASILEERTQNKQPSIRCMVITAILEGSDTPAVVYHGNELDYTVLSVAVATELRNNIIRKISGGL